MYRRSPSRRITNSSPEVASGLGWWREGLKTAADGTLLEAEGMTQRRTRRAKRPLAYALLAILSAGVLAASAVGLALRGWSP